MKKECIALMVAMMSSPLVSVAQLNTHDVQQLYHLGKEQLRNEIVIPNVSGFKVLKCDFHTHTLLSDGAVWPNMRVDEAWSEGLDVLAITDHIEYRPMKNIIKGDLNESNRLAKNAAKNRGIIVVNGTEITRQKPLGHFNALFITDAEAIKKEDGLESIDEANKQGAFIMWNHPGWPDNKSTLYPVHQKLIKENKIHGVEVFNCMDYYPVIADWCKDYNIAPMATSDIHGLISTTYDVENGCRPMTLVFAKNKTEQALKEAMFAKRTVAFFQGQLSGSEKWLNELFFACVLPTAVGDNYYELFNTSDIPYTLKVDGHTYILPAGKTMRMRKPRELSFVVENCHVGLNKNLAINRDAFFK